MRKSLFGGMKNQEKNSLSDDLELDDLELEDLDLMDMDAESEVPYTEENVESDLTYTEENSDEVLEEVFEEEALSEGLPEEDLLEEEVLEEETSTDENLIAAAMSDEDFTGDLEDLGEDLEEDLEEVDLEEEDLQEVDLDTKEDEDDDEIVLGWLDMPDKNIFQKIWYSLVHMSAMDRVLTTTGIFILILALIAGTIYVDKKLGTHSQAVDSEFAVGTQIDGITVIGEKGLLAVSDSEKTKNDFWTEDAEVPEEEEGNYEENEYVKDVTVSMNLTSIEKDLKIKFVNKESNKLIANVPFEVELKTPDKKTETWVDEDMDGIIYKAKLTPGSYTVTMKALTDEKYKDIAFETETRKIEVKKEIAYEKVDVSDEIKSDSEVGSGEDGGKNNGDQEESTLQDTVAWVESSKTVLEEGYTPVDKKTIVDPLTAAIKKSFMRMGSLNLPDMSLKVNEIKTITLPTIEGIRFETPVYTVEDSSIAFVQGSNLVGAKAGTTTINVSVVGWKAADLSGGNQTSDTYSGSFKVTVTSEEVAVTAVALSESKLTLSVGDEATLTATITPENATNKELTWKSNNDSVVSVENGKIKALKAGTATITVASAADATKKATCAVTVNEKPETRTLTIDPKEVSMVVGSKTDIKAIVKNTDANGSVSGVVNYKVDKTDVLDIVMGDEVNGVTTYTISAKKNGTATITFTLQDTKLTGKCTVTVGNRSLKLDKTSMSVLEGKSNTMQATIGSSSGEFKAESSNTTVATVKISETKKDTDGNLIGTVEVTGVKAGSANITVIHTENGTDVKQTFAVTVITKDKKLVDKNNQPYYVMTGTNQYREATYADYYDASITTLYLKTAGKIKYTGWQTIDGKRYYFTAEGNYVTGEQVIQGVKYTFASDGSLVTGSGNFGIDVSKWNGTIDWNAVKNSGVNYVIIRSGYRGSSKGALVADPKFEANIKGANAAGIKVGIYFFSQAVNKTEAVEEASMVLQQVKNYKISYPIFIDVEEVEGGGRANNIDKATRTEVIKAFCQTIQNSGYTAGVYANKTWLTEKIDTSQLGSYKIWLAQYAAQPTYTGRYDMWQYKKTGKVNGISGDVDLNISYLGY